MIYYLLNNIKKDLYIIYTFIMSSLFSSPLSMNNKITTEVLKNKIFLDNHVYFVTNGWKLKENTITDIVYVHPNYPTDEFKVNINNKLIKITIPVLSSNYAYSTTFKSYYQASEYLQLHLKHYMDKITENNF